MKGLQDSPSQGVKCETRILWFVEVHLLEKAGQERRGEQLGPRRADNKKGPYKALASWHALDQTAIIPGSNKESWKSR